MTFIWGQKQPTQKSQASEVSTDWFNNKNYKDPLKSNKPELFEALETLTGLLKALFPTLSTLDVVWYT